MRIPPPSSRGAFRFRFGVFDIVWIVLSPVLALYLSNANALSSANWLEIVVLYSGVWATASAIAFLFFRVQDSVPGHFSVFDALEVSKAVIAAELIACIALFTLTRLEGIPRSAPILHASILAAGLIMVRLANRILSDNRKEWMQGSVASEHILVIGSNQFASLYIKLVKACGSFKHVVGVLDDRPRLLGRMLEGVRIVGAPGDLDALLDEYTVHGVRVDRIVVSGGPDFLPGEEMSQIRSVCVSRQIGLDFLPALVGLAELGPTACVTPTIREVRGSVANATALVPSTYFRFKPAIDFCIALTLLVLLLPILVIVSLMALIDVGSPVLFWQRRLGLRGQSFLLYKFRTLRPPFDGSGLEIPPERRLSWIGHLLRDTSLDELPQLFNILVGDMSLIGPRPLLPKDQPSQSAGRLLVRPGITGWAQVNGGKLLTAEEKVKFDEWYVENASLWVDIKLVVKTLQIVLLGAQRSNEAVIGPGKPEIVEHWQNFQVVKTDPR